MGNGIHTQSSTGKKNFKGRIQDMETRLAETIKAVIASANASNNEKIEAAKDSFRVGLEAAAKDIDAVENKLDALDLFASELAKASDNQGNDMIGMAKRIRRLEVYLAILCTLIAGFGLTACFAAWIIFG